MEDTNDGLDIGVFTRTANKPPEPIHVAPRIDAEKYQADIPPMLAPLTCVSPPAPSQGKRGPSNAGAASVATTVAANSKGEGNLHFVFELFELFFSSTIYHINLSNLSI